MTDYYVSTTGNNGNTGLSVAAAWRNIDFAVDNAAVGPGDRILVKAGTYVERVLATVNSGTIVNPIELISIDGPLAAKINGGYNLPTGTPVGDSGVDCPVTNTLDNPLTFTNGAPAGQFRGYDFVFGALLQFQDVGHWIIDGFEVRESRGRGVSSVRTTNITYRNMLIDGARTAMWWTNGTDTTIEDSVMQDGGNFFPYARSVSCSNWPVGVNMIEAVNTTVQRNCIRQHWGEGVGTGRGSVNCVIVDNTIYDNMAMDLYVHYSQNATIQRNIIWRSSTNKYNRGANPPSNMVVNMESASFGDFPPSDNFQIKNNLIFGRDNYSVDFWNNQGGGATSGIIRFINNTVLNAGNTGIGAARGFPLHSITNGNTHSDTDVQNNIFWNLSGAAAFDPTATVIANNFDWSNNIWNVAPPASMQGPGDIIGTPSLVGPLVTPGPNVKLDPTIAHQVLGSISLDAGTSDDAPPTDYIGTARPQDAADDIGFHELDIDNEPPSKGVLPQSDSVGDTIAAVFFGSDPENDPLTYSETGLPPGLSIDPATGLISGTPTTAGIYNFEVCCNDGVNVDFCASSTWTILAVGDCEACAIVNQTQVTQGQQLVLNGQELFLDPRCSTCAGIATYTVNFGDGTIVSGPGPFTHTYAQGVTATTYPITVEVNCA